MLDIESSALLDLLNNEKGATTPGLKGHLREVADECESSGKSALEVAENFGLFTKEEMLQMIADNLGSYVWNPKNTDVALDIIALIDTNVARTHGVIPVAVDGNTIYMAMRKPLDYQTLEAVRFILNKEIVPVVCDPDLFEDELDRYYPEKADTIADIVAEFDDVKAAGDELSEEDQANDAPIVKFVDVV